MPDMFHISIGSFSERHRDCLDEFPKKDALD
jgi:hypothetical protein